MIRILFLALAAALALLPQVALPCAVCFGKTDSNLAQGMNAGVFLLLGVVGCVLGAIAAFFIYLIKRSSTHGGPGVSTNPPQSTK